jgi:hypothetical protein
MGGTAGDREDREGRFLRDTGEVAVLRPSIAYPAIVALILLAILRSAIATRTDSFTIDEAYHITAGVSYVKLRDFRLNPEHPPLVKLWVGALLAPHFQLPALRPLQDKAAERQFTESVVFLDNNPDRVRAQARVAMWILNGVLMLFLAFAVVRTMGTAVALAAVAFLAIDPTVAANLGVVMTDLPVALTAATAILLSVQAFRTGSWLDTVLAALALGLTLGAKHSGVIAIPVVALLGIAAVVKRRKAIIQLIAIGIGALIVLWALYDFRYTETPSGQEAFNRPLALKITDVRSNTSRMALQAMTNAHLAPRSYVWGLADTIRAGIEGRGIRIYFFGRTFRDRGPFYYFPTILAAKLPIGLLLLALAGLALLPLRILPGPWNFPAAALLLLGGAFLIALIRGVSYGGVRHALPILIVLAIFGGMAAALALMSGSRAPRVLVAIAAIAAVVSAVPRIRPWEYFNEAFGGPDGAYLRFSDESVDVGQRDLDFVRYYNARLKPAGIIPHLFYPMSINEQKRRDVQARGERGGAAERDDQPADVTGIFFVRSSAIFKNPRLQIFSKARPTDRIGNLLIYNGTFHLPWLREARLTRRVRRLLISPNPDLTAVEAALREVLTANPQSFVGLLQSGNLMLREGKRNEATAFYRRALEQVGDEDAAMQDALKAQIARLASTEPLDHIQPVRGTRVE